MSEQRLQHLVIVRHGEGEGDIRRAAAKRGKHDKPLKTPLEEELTQDGVEQSKLAGIWIAENVLKSYGLSGFDSYFVSPPIRNLQSAQAIDPSANWKIENLLDERDRGVISGFPRQAHATIYPESYETMISDPLRWIPPGGESILSVVERANKFVAGLQTQSSVIAVTHRDWIWASKTTLEMIEREKLTDVDTDNIHNSQIIHYTTIDPTTGEDTRQLIWKRTICPWSSPSDVIRDSGNWEKIQESALNTAGEN
jgi:broad specificity phosphatase PhoE